MSGSNVTVSLLCMGADSISCWLKFIFESLCSGIVLYFNSHKETSKQKCLPFSSLSEGLLRVWTFLEVTSAAKVL